MTDGLCTELIGEATCVSLNYSLPRPPLHDLKVVDDPKVGQNRPIATALATTRAPREGPKTPWEAQAPP